MLLRPAYCRRASTRNFLPPIDNSFHLGWTADMLPLANSPIPHRVDEDPLFEQFPEVIDPQHVEKHLPEKPSSQKRPVRIPHPKNASKKKSGPKSALFDCIPFEGVLHVHTAHATHAAARCTMCMLVFLRRLSDPDFVREQQARYRGGVLQSQTRHLGGIQDAHFDHIAVLA